MKNKNQPSGWQCRREENCTALYHAGTGEIQLKGPGGVITGRVLKDGLRIQIEKGVFVIRNTLRLQKRKPEKIAALAVLSIPLQSGLKLGGKPADYRQFVNSRGMISHTGTRRLIPGIKRDPYDVDDVIWRQPESSLENELWSWTVTSVWCPQTRGALTMSFDQPQDISGAFIVENKRLQASVFVDQPMIKSNGIIDLPPLRIDLSREPREALEQTVLQGPRRNKINDPRMLCNWNSFDYYRQTERLEDILENADFIAQTPWLKKHVKAIVVDESWEYAFGEWNVVEHKYPGGLQRLAREIRKRNLMPGIWTAPFLARCNVTRLAAWRADLMARDAEGEVCHSLGGACMVLDPTHPEVEKMTGNLYKRLYGAGFRLFKLDFLDCVLQARRFHDARSTPTAALRHGMEIIRKALGADAVILGCNGPQESVTGIVDTNRIGNDIHNLWSHAQACGRSTLWRWWMNGQWWWNDPDMMTVRGPQTSDHRTMIYQRKTPFTFGGWLAGDEFSEKEAQFWATVCLLSGGLITLSDRLPHLNRRGLAILKKILPLMTATAARPVDYWTAAMPAIWVQPTAAEGNRLALLNAYDVTCKVQVDLHEAGWAETGSLSFRELWSGRVIKSSGGKISIVLPPRTAVLLIPA